MKPTETQQIALAWAARHEHPVKFGKLSLAASTGAKKGWLKRRQGDFGGPLTRHEDENGRVRYVNTKERQ